MSDLPNRRNGIGASEAAAALGLSPLQTPCIVANCNRRAVSKSMCDMHYRRAKKYGDPLILKHQKGRGCSVIGCDGKHQGHGFCQKHYLMFRRNGDPLNRQKAPAGSGYLRSGYHVRGSNGSQISVHREIVEKTIGRLLPEKAEVHHVNGNKSDNRNENLVVCPSRSYHQLLHIRTRALDASGDANKRVCVYCAQYDNPSNMRRQDKKTSSMCHRQCAYKYQLEYKEKHHVK